MNKLFTLLALIVLLPLHAATYTTNGVLTFRSGTRNALPTSVTVTDDTNTVTGGLVVQGPQTNNATVIYTTTNIVGTAVTLDFAGALEGTITLSGTTTFTFVNQPTNKTCVFQLGIVGGHDVIWPTGTITSDGTLTNSVPANTRYALAIEWKGGTNYISQPWYLENQVATNSARLDVVESAVSVNTSDITSLQNQLDDLYAQSGTQATPTTTDPLSPTWTGYQYTVWYGATGTINLPAVANYTGRTILIYNTGAFTITVDPNGSEVIVRDGTVQTGGVSMTLNSGAGHFVALLCDGERWITLGYSGTLAQGS